MDVPTAEAMDGTADARAADVKAAAVAVEAVAVAEVVAAVDAGSPTAQR